MEELIQIYWVGFCGLTIGVYRDAPIKSVHILSCSDTLYTNWHVGNIGWVLHKFCVARGKLLDAHFWLQISLTIECSGLYKSLV